MTDLTPAEQRDILVEGIRALIRDALDCSPDRVRFWLESTLRNAQIPEPPTEGDRAVWNRAVEACQTRLRDVQKATEEQLPIHVQQLNVFDLLEDLRR